MWRQPRYTGPERRKTRRWRPRPLRVLLSLLILLAAGYVAGVVWLMTQETRLVFQAGATLGAGRPSFPFEQIDLPRSDGARQFAWRMPLDHADRAPWVLFLHGNAATIASNVNISHYRLLRAVGLNTLAPEYRGFSGLAGTPTRTPSLRMPGPRTIISTTSAVFPHRGLSSMGGRSDRRWRYASPPRSKKLPSSSKAPRHRSRTSASTSIRSFRSAW